MPIARVVVKDFMNWGKLVKTWATGVDYVGNGHDYLPPPTTLPAFKEQVEQAECGMTIPPRITDFTMIPGDTKTLVVRLPPGEMIKDSEAMFEVLIEDLGTSKYPLPVFYDKAWGKRHEQVSFDKEDLLCFHAMRIGEYTINNCA